MKKLLLCLPLITVLYADDYSFDMDEIEVKSYQYSGYLKAEHKKQNLKNDTSRDALFGEAFLDFDYFKDNFTLSSQTSASMNNIDGTKQTNLILNELYGEYKYTSNHSWTLGKHSLKWGKGYFFNPVAFLDRKKDVNDPESSREGYILGKYTFNKVYQGAVQNFALDLVVMPTSFHTNDDFYNQSSTNVALKTYFLVNDIDIDFIYVHNNQLQDRWGVDFSANLQTNIEIHGEFAKQKHGEKSALLGLKYLTTNDLTITSELFYQSEQLDQTQSFWDNKYFMNKFSQKEPLGIVYCSAYYKNSLNLKDHSYSNTLGVNYGFKNNIDLDLSYNFTHGDNQSEFGSKMVEDFLWTQLSWHF
ncbi:MAG: hypothetical protein U9N30_00070 [Campylobacterota bacterium]|nr:hypothetical protein [Campylobacterota bacterium]